MKKVLLGLLATSALAMAQTEGTNLYLKVGADIWQKYETISTEGKTVTSNKADSLGYELGMEITKEVLQNIELGFGIAYQDHGDIKSKSIYDYGIDYEDVTNVEVGSYKSVPLYVTAKYNIPLESSIKPYIKADLGYSFNFDENSTKLKWNYKENNAVLDSEEMNLSTSIDNGMYYGIGAGMEYNDFLVEIMYKVNKADVKVTDGVDKVSGDLDYSRVTLSFGYKFNF